MRSKILAVLLLPALSAAAVLAAAPARADSNWKLYAGAEQPQEAVATFNLWNFPKFTSKLQIYTVSFDAENFEAKGGIGLVPAAGGQVQVLPGKHRVRVSFVDTKGWLLPVFMDSRVFPGWYELEFEAKAGMLYAPIFNVSREHRRLTDEMCIAEVPFSKRLGTALRQTRETTVYVACAAPTLDPQLDRDRWCSSWDRSKSVTVLCPHTESND